MFQFPVPSPQVLSLLARYADLLAAGPDRPQAQKFFEDHKGHPGFQEHALELYRLEKEDRKGWLLASKS